MAGPASFIIPNDPAAIDNPAVYPAQARPSALDFQILGAAATGTGALAPTVYDADQGWPYITPPLLTTVAFVSGATTTITMESTVGYFPTSGTAYITDPTGALSTSFDYSGISGSNFTGVTSSGGVTFAIGSTVSALCIISTGTYYMVQGERFQYNVTTYARTPLSAPDATYPRWDIIAHSPDSTSALKIIEGVPGPNPTPPTLTLANGGLDANGEVYICVMATVYVPANAKIFSTDNNMVSKRVKVNWGLPHFINGLTNTGPLLAGVQRYYTWAAWAAAKTATLPAASNVPAGYVVAILDSVGGCSSARTLTVSPAGADTINGAASIVASSPYCCLTFVSDGISKWTVESSRGTFGATNFTGDVAMGGNKITGLPVSSATGDAVAHEQMARVNQTILSRTTQVQSPANTSINLMATDPIPASQLVADGDAVECMTYYSLAGAGRDKFISVTVAGVAQCTVTEIDDSSTGVEVRVRIVRTSSTVYRVQTTLTSNGTIPGTLGGGAGEAPNIKHFFTERTAVAFGTGINVLTYFQISTGAVLGDATLQFGKTTYLPA